MISRDEMTALDSADPLAASHAQFDLPDGIIYLDGNSLGPVPKGVPERLAQVVNEQWRGDLIKSWNVHGWMDMPLRVGDRIAPLIGAGPDEVLASDTTSVNLFKLMAAALEQRPDRKVIVGQTGNFPTDNYLAEGLIRFTDNDHELRLVDGDDVLDAIDDTVALVSLTQVDYRSGYVQDMAAVTAAAHDAGALMLWDLSHSAGAMAVDLNGAQVDFAVGCSYKYLNGGPGAPAYLFVPRRLQDLVRQPLSGWLGHAAPFEFEQSYRPAPGILRQQCGTPSILAMSALDAALDVFDGLDMALVRQKSLSLTEHFIALMEQRCAGHGFTLATPREQVRRGSQVSWHHEMGYPIMQALIAEGVIGDFRSPDILRFGFAPLYLRYVDVWDAVMVIDKVMSEGRWDRPEFHQRSAVT
ncbi:MAG: kynureninase [Rhodospirillaceae bacterium]|jgi:kynureninase|nr:kynureninase [Rhodospirillaceae bacterium]MBT5191895.1 kynureninase [Rhodospirillaceae bacterium]MBT5897059.1 kynureninase [Rhodospirillaceae bacterium]